MRFLRRLFSVRISDLVSDRHPCRAETPVAQTHLTVRDPEMRSLRLLLVTRAGRLTRIGGRHVPRLARGPPPRPLPITALTGLFWATGSINAITARRLACRRVTRWTTLTKNSPRPKITRAARRRSINAESPRYASPWGNRCMRLRSTDAGSCFSSRRNATSSRRLRGCDAKRIFFGDRDLIVQRPSGRQGRRSGGT